MPASLEPLNLHPDYAIISRLEMTMASRKARPTHRREDGTVAAALAIATHSESLSPVIITLEFNNERGLNLKAMTSEEWASFSMLPRRAEIKPVGPSLYESPMDKATADNMVTHQHYKGGLYRMLAQLESSSGEMILYAHLYPHAPCLWCRPKAIWDSKNEDGSVRFKPL